MSLLTVLNYSGGRQSARILWGVIRGDIPKPDSFVVLNADPGMENSDTYKYNIMMKEECIKNDIYFETVNGPNLYKDLINLTINGQTRVDNPPYWTLNKKGKRGRLQQKCTRYYKLQPMDRAIRKLLFERFNINLDAKRIGYDIVERWIGFAADEKQRISPSRQKYQTIRYPLIEMNETREDVNQYFYNNSLPIPPRSVCNACFANGIDTFKDMYYNRPDDWNEAVKIDEACRDLSQIGINDQVFVSRTLVPLKDFPKYDFDSKKMPIYKYKTDQETLFIDATVKNTNNDEDDWSCDSGVCFL